jgi:NAD(P)-dependent dehydrogenase (short-subunit alcohol dehydrogenase family)
MPVPTLSGQRVVVIGGSSGIGFAVAEAALADGATVVVGSSNDAKVQAAVERLGAGASGRAVNVREEGSVQAFVEAAGAFDHLVFTAGDWGGNPPSSGIADLDFATAGAVLNVRFWGALMAIKHALPGLSQAGSITLTDGVRAHRPAKGAPLSTAFAGAIEHLTMGLAVDLAPVRVNAVCPGVILTEVWDSVPAERLGRMTERLPVPRAGQPSEVAQAYIYLMRGGYTTGQVLVVDGGYMLV